MVVVVVVVACCVEVVVVVWAVAVGRPRWTSAARAVPGLSSSPLVLGAPVSG